MSLHEVIYCFYQFDTTWYTINFNIVNGGIALYCDIHNS